MKKNRKAGFTLAELLIVVAIIGVLAAVAVPVFAGTLEKSRETVCLHNRIVLQRHLMYDRMTDESKEPTQDALVAYIDSDAAKCPGGGTYKLEYDKSTGAIGVSCSKHAPGGLTNESAASLEYNKWLEEYLKDPANGIDQQSVVLAYKKYLEVQGKPFLTVPKDEVLSLLPDNVTGFWNVTDNNPLVWVPLRIRIGKDYEEVMLVTSKTQANGNDPRKGFVFSYKGEYYRSNKVNNKGVCDYQGLYTSGQHSSFEEFISKSGWVKVEK